MSDFGQPATALALNLLQLQKDNMNCLFENHVTIARVYIARLREAGLPVPANETKRLEALLQLGLLDTLPEKQFDNTVALAAALLNTPTALITLVDHYRQWFKARIGMERPETPREVSFCQYTILDDCPMVVENALEDPRFVNNPLVTEPNGIRFYAGAPLLTSSGYAIGSLCIIDSQPRTATAEQIGLLQCLAEQVVHLAEARAKLVAQGQLLELVANALEKGEELLSEQALAALHKMVARPSEN